MHSTKQNWTRYALRWSLTSALIVSSLLTLPACTAKQPLVRTEVATKVVEKYRPLPSGLTETVGRPVAPEGRMTWQDIAELGLAWRTVALRYERQLLKIKALEEVQ